MGLLHDLLMEARTEQFEKDLKNAYGMGFRDGRLCGPDLRPCEVDGKPATFHRWVEEDRGILQIHAFTKPDYIDQVRREYEEENIIPACASLEKLHEVKALVEWPDGSVSTVALELITFLDRREG